MDDPLRPIPGRRLGPLPKPKPKAIARFERDRPWARIGWLALERFKAANVTLIAGGTAYYAFVAMFSLLAFVYGVATLVDADQIATWMTKALEEALPGLVGEGGVDPTALEQLGRTTSVIGLAVLLWSGLAVMVATSNSLRTIYGAGPDGRDPATKRVHLLGWLAVVGPLIMLSYTLATAVTRISAVWSGGLVTLALDLGITALLLGRLGGIRPPTRPLLVGSAVGALVIGVLKAAMAAIVSWSIDKPQYGSFTIPIAILVVLWLQAIALYACACLTAAAADQAAVGSGGEAEPQPSVA